MRKDKLQASVLSESLALKVAQVFDGEANPVRESELLQRAREESAVQSEFEALQLIRRELCELRRDEERAFTRSVSLWDGIEKSLEVRESVLERWSSRLAEFFSDTVQAMQQPVGATAFVGAALVVFLIGAGTLPWQSEVSSSGSLSLGTAPQLAKVGGTTGAGTVANRDLAFAPQIVNVSQDNNPLDARASTSVVSKPRLLSVSPIAQGGYILQDTLARHKYYRRDLIETPASRLQAEGGTYFKNIRTRGGDIRWLRSGRLVNVVNNGKHSGPPIIWVRR